MKVYQVSLNIRSKKFNSAKKCIESMHHTCHFLHNTWFVATNNTALHLREMISNVIEENDEFMISRVKPDAAWHGVDHHVSKNIKRILDISSD